MDPRTAGPIVLVIRKAAETGDMGNSNIRALFRLVPGGIRVIDGHRFCKPRCVGTKILFVDGSRSVDNESHYARGAILRWIGDEGKSSGHLAINEVVSCSAPCMRTLAGEDSEKI